MHLVFPTFAYDFGCTVAITSRRTLRNVSTSPHQEYSNMKAALSSIATFMALASRVLAADPPPFAVDITQGNIRVVLISVGQITVFPNEEDRPALKSKQPTGLPGVPCFAATFLVESLGDEPLGLFTLKTFEIESAGKPVELVHKSGDYQQAFDYRAL